MKRTDERRPIVNIMTNLMGQMMSSRLFIEVREKRGLCYYISADKAEYFDTGAWMVSAGVDVKRTEEAIRVILAEIEKIKNEPVTDEELKRAKENFKGHMFLSLEESFAVASLLAEQQLLLGKIKDPDELAQEIDKVTKEDIMAVAKEIFVPEHLNLAMVSPDDDQEKYLKILNEFK
jgi:predicted Zn-dependent peptidase